MKSMEICSPPPPPSALIDLEELIKKRAFTVKHMVQQWMNAASNEMCSRIDDTFTDLLRECEQKYRNCIAYVSDCDDGDRMKALAKDSKRIRQESDMMTNKSAIKNEPKRESNWPIYSRNHDNSKTASKFSPEDPANEFAQFNNSELFVDPSMFLLSYEHQNDEDGDVDTKKGEQNKLNEKSLFDRSTSSSSSAITFTSSITTVSSSSKLFDHDQLSDDTLAPTNDKSLIPIMNNSETEIAKEEEEEDEMMEEEVEEEVNENVTAMVAAEEEAEAEQSLNTRLRTIYLLCVHCEPRSATFATKRSLDKHMDEVHRIKAHRCLYPGCRSSFTSKQQLGDHLKISHRAVSRWPCEHCAKHFSTHNILYQHNRAYHEPGMYACAASSDACRASFRAANRVGVETHYALTHDVVRCPFEGCGRSMARTHFATHRRRHTNVRPYACGFARCEYRSTTSPSVLRHIRAVHFGHSTTISPQIRKSPSTSTMIGEHNRDARQYLVVHHHLLKR